MVEAGLGHLPFTERSVVTPTGSPYVGVDFAKKLCGVSIIRSGESMENALRACCKGIKIGKILVHRCGAAVVHHCMNTLQKCRVMWLGDLEANSVQNPAKVGAGQRGYRCGARSCMLDNSAASYLADTGWMLCWQHAMTAGWGAMSKCTVSRCPATAAASP